MDFKVAGTERGITALQLDTKLPGLPLPWLSQAVTVARKAHKKLLKWMGQEVERARREATTLGGAEPQHKVL